MSELQTPLTCNCGRTVVARAADAGGLIPCECGTSVAVPNLSKLRVLAGADAFITNPAEAIRKLQAEGKNPAGDLCLLCGSPNVQRYACSALCESSHLKRGVSDDPTSVPRLLSLIFLPRLILFCLMSGRTRTEPEIRGHDIEVAFMLPVCRLCGEKAGDVSRPRVATQLMAKVPLLAELISYYPRMKLTVEQAES